MNTELVGYEHPNATTHVCQGGMSDFRAKLTRKDLIAPSIYALELALIEPKIIDFVPGQFINIRVPKEDSAVKRSYSIASPCGQKDTLTLCLKFLLEGSASRYFAKMQLGEEVRFDGPHGFFVIRDKSVPIRMIATGTGITPFMSMIPDLGMSDVALYFGVRSEGDIFWKDRLDTFTQMNKQFRYTITLSQPADAWQGERGRVTQHTSRIIHPNPDAHYYICGSPPMVIDMRRLLIEKGIEPKKIFFELFT